MSRMATFFTFLKATAVTLFALSAASGSQHIISSPPSSANFLQNSIFSPSSPSILSELDTPLCMPPVPSYEDNNAFQGLTTFAHLPFAECTLASANMSFDIGIVGHPFDLGVSYRPGARFGPSGARLGARRLSPAAGFDMDHVVNPFRNWAEVVDCGDIENTPYDKLIAIHELEKGMAAITQQTSKNASISDVVRIISIGGDHTITLPILRALHKTWGRVAVLHFDSHLDTWDPHQLGGGLTKYSEVNHGTMLHIAHEEGLLSNHSNMHLGSRCALYEDHFDLDNDLRCGFSYVLAREIDRIGVAGVVKKIVERVGDELVYLSVDIDVLDPAFAPATGTIEPGGWTTRELLAIIQGLSDAGLKIIGSDVVEFTPIYDNAAETTGIAVGQIIYEILQWMIKVPVKRPEA